VEKLYEQYGELMIRMEVLQGQINEVKRLIAEQLNKGGKNAVEKRKE